jgi:amphi-Trp domain-containing protein
MGRETILYKSEEEKTTGEIAVLLSKIAERVEQGSISLGQGESKITLDFPKSLTLEIKVEEEVKVKTKRSIEIELEWIVGDEKQGGVVIG